MEMFPGGIAQLVEHMVRNHGVEGSNPFTSTKSIYENKETKPNPHVFKRNGLVFS